MTHGVNKNTEVSVKEHIYTRHCVAFCPKKFQQ